MSWGVSAWGESPWASVASFDDPLTVTDVDVWAADLLAITFSAPVKNNETLQDTDNYIVASELDAPEILVKKVVTGSETYTDTVYLHVAGMGVGSQYHVSVVSATGIQGIEIDTAANYGRFIGRRTKVDSILANLPKIYDKRIASRIRTVLTAFARQDDLIGGNINTDYRLPYGVTASSDDSNVFVGLNSPNITGTAEIVTVSESATADTPLTLYPASLRLWFDSASGTTVTDVSGIDRPTVWTERSSNGYSATPYSGTNSNAPRYLSSDDDGTPSVSWDTSEGTKSFDINIPTNSGVFTFWMFVYLPSIASYTDPKTLMWSSSSIRGLMPHGWTSGPSGNGYPSIYNGAWWSPVQTAISGWHLLRFSVDDVNDVMTIQIDDEAEVTYSAGAFSWGAASWTQIGRPDSASQNFLGKVKHMIQIDEYINSADPEQQEMLDFIASRHPTLVSW